MWNGNNNNFHRHPEQAQAQAQAQQAQQQQQALRRRLSLELAAAAYNPGGVNGNGATAASLLGAAAAGFRGTGSGMGGGINVEDHLALAVAAQAQARQQVAVEAVLAQEERNTNLAIATAAAARQQQQQLELMALHRQQQAQAQQQHQHHAALAAQQQELQRRTSSEIAASTSSPTQGSSASNGSNAAAAVQAVASAVASEFEEPASTTQSSKPSTKQTNKRSAATSKASKPVASKESNGKSGGKKKSSDGATKAKGKAKPKTKTKAAKQSKAVKKEEFSNTQEDTATDDKSGSSRSPSPEASPTPGEEGEDSQQQQLPIKHKPSKKAASALQPIQPRGKPEAMAKKLANAVRQQKILEELEAEKQKGSKMDSLGTHSSEATGVATPSNKSKSNGNSASSKKSSKASSSKKRKKPEDTKSNSSSQSPSSKRKKVPSAKKRAATSATSKKGGSSNSSGGNSRSSSNKRGSSGSASGGGSGSSGSGFGFGNGIPAPTMDDPVEPITEIEYGKLEALMEQFCRVPLLAEFSRPVALLHPELMNAYTKIVEHPVDLGKVCRRIRRRQYENLRDVRLDAWRIFANCFKYHSHPSNKDAVPSFVSIALHLRDLFNDLWQEHILGSDFPPPAPTGTGRSKPQDPNAALRAAMKQRIEFRKKRLVVSGLSVMAGKCLERAAEALSDIIENGGLVDALDTKPIWGDGVVLDDDDEGDLEVVLENFRKLELSLREIIANNEELGVDELESSVRKCYTKGDGLENMNAILRIRIGSRMDRYLGQLVVPIHEATCRGVSQSSIWGCMAAAVWARESSKKPFWPALVLGIIAPEDQKEDWHNFLTERNEARLPEKLKSQLLTGKRKAEQAVKRQSMGQADPQSFFLVEFLGSHEFIWVREADIVENFNPADDPNKKDSPGSRSKKVSRKSLANILGSKTYANAIEEAQWALEEFELQLQDIGGAAEDDEEDEHEEEGYSYSVLSQSDDEADGETDDDDDEVTSESLDQDECNELLATNGLLDFSVAGRKRRAQIIKQQKLNAEKKQKTVKAKKDRAAKAKKAKDEKQKEKEKRQEKRDLEKKRRKRMREREKALKGVQHQKKKRKLSDPAPGRRHQIVSKRERAEAIVSGYVSRAAESGDYKPLGLNGEQRWIQSALIDSTNLSGMALAFRAAAGMIPMPKQDTGAPGKIVLRPWDKIRVKGKKTSSERTNLLHQQIDLLQKEIRLRKASRARRVKRRKEVEEAVIKMNSSIREDDKLARENPLKKSKKPHPLAGKKRKRSGDAKAEPKTDASKKTATTSSSTTTTPSKPTKSSPSEKSQESKQKAIDEGLVSVLMGLGSSMKKEAEAVEESSTDNIKAEDSGDVLVA